MMRSQYEYKAGETGVEGASFMKHNKLKCMGGGVRGKAGYLWDYLTSHLPCNLAEITRLGTATNTPVITAVRTTPTGARDKNAMK